jgi:hypothetical protein
MIRNKIRLENSSFKCQIDIVHILVSTCYNCYSDVKLFYINMCTTNICPVLYCTHLICDLDMFSKFPVHLYLALSIYKHAYSHNKVSSYLLISIITGSMNTPAVIHCMFNNSRSMQQWVIIYLGC